MTGEEASFIVVANGTKYLPMASSQDHKRRDAGDRGPNTGGMGALSPTPAVDEKTCSEIIGKIIEPTLAGPSSEGGACTGVWCAGGMLTAQGHRGRELSARLGDAGRQPSTFR